MKNHSIIIFMLLTIGILAALGFSHSNGISKGNPDFSVLHQKLNDYVDSGQLAGISALISNNNEVLFSENFGFQNIENQDPVTENTIFRLASLTKPVVSVAVLQLIEEGKLNLDDSVEKYLPFFRNVKVFSTQQTPKNSMTIRHLLTHTSGISSGFGQDEVGALFRAFNAKASDLEEYVKEIVSIPLCTEPGMEFNYGHSTDVLALVIEKVSGKRIDRYLKEHLFTPLGMTKTDYFLTKEDLKNFATLYVLDDKNQLKAFGDNAESIFIKGHFPKGNYGLVSTISDYAKFAKMLLNKGSYKGKRILSEESVKALSNNQLSGSQLPVKAGPMVFNDLGFGFGVAVSNGNSPLGRTKGTFGWIGATHTYCFIDPDKEIISLLFSQYSGSKPCPIIFEFNSWVEAAFEEK